MRTRAAPPALASGGLGFWVAAIRECFEECGVLIAHGDQGADQLRRSRLSPAVCRSLRDALERPPGNQLFSQICVQENLVPARRFAHLLLSLAHPAGYAQTLRHLLFSSAQCQPNQVPLHDGHETVSGLWVTPAQALEKRGGRRN